MLQAAPAMPTVPEAMSSSMSSSGSPMIRYQPIVYVPYVPLVDSCTQKKAEEARNKRLVRRFTQGLFGEKNISCIDQFIAPNYIQHNPTVADGRESLKTAARGWFQGDETKGTVDIKRVSADGDLVWVHSKDKDEEGRVMAVVDIYRVKDGKIQEHWDVMQVLTEPEKSKNKHPLF